MNSNSAGDLAGDYIDRCIDIDSHEMAPLQKWPEIFGEEADEIVELCKGLKALNEGGDNTLNRPDIYRDDSKISVESVWSQRGPYAPSAFDFTRRIEVMDIMGVDRQLVYPGYGFIGTHLVFNPAVGQLMGFDDTASDIASLGRRAISGHNNWCIRETKRLGERVRPVALLLVDTLDQMMRDAENMIAEGIRAVMIPHGVPPAEMSPADAALDPFWSLFASANVPITFHIGTDGPLFRSHAWAQNVPAFEGAETLEVTIQPYWGATVNFAAENYLAAMILGGVLERHPTLRIGVIESGAQWVGPLAERLDLWASQFRPRLGSILAMKPSEYMNRQVRATPFFFEDVVSYFDRYPHLHNVYAFSTDYPHVEGGRQSKQVFAQNLSGCNAIIKRKFFRDNGSLLVPD